MSRRPESGTFTRRAIFRGAAVAGAAALVRPAAGLGKDVPALFSLRVGTLAGGETNAIAAPRTFSLVGVEWAAPAGARVEVRTRPANGEPWSRWVSASVGGHGPDRAAAGGQHFGEPIWTGPAAGRAWPGWPAHRPG